MLRIQNSFNLKSQTIAIYGLGNVGGPIAAAWLKKDANVIGVDISRTLLDSILDGTSHSKEPFITEIFTKNLKRKTLSLTSDGIEASKNSTIKIIAVPVDIKNNKINLSAILSVTKDISYGLKKGDTVIVCPSLPPGTTEKIILPILEQGSNLKGEKDFFLIYNPERIFEGRALEDIEKNYPAIVSGLGKKSLEFGTKFLSIISQKGVLQISTLANAEAEKLFEGVYRDVNIALANELADFCEKSGLDYWESRKGANSQPFCHLHYPGTGVGGLCIPVYPQFVIQSAKKIKKSMKIVKNARIINDSMPKKCVNDAIQFLLENKKIQKNSKVAILGLGFRGDVVDSRLSPTYDVVKEFIKKNFLVYVHDPYILKDSKLPKNVILSSNLELVIKNSDLIFISTDHRIYSNLNKKTLRKSQNPLLIYDGRNILSKKNFSSKTLISIGRR